MSSTPGPPAPDQPDKSSPTSGRAGDASGNNSGGGPPSEDLDHFPTLEDNAASPADPLGDSEAMPTRMEAERTVPFADGKSDASENTSVASGSGAGSAGGTSAHPPLSATDAEPTTRDSVPTRVMPPRKAGQAKPVSRHVKALIDANLFAPAGSLATERGAFAVVEGRYELRETLGEGGMGLVFLAYDNVGDCLVALKTLKPNFLNSAKSRARFIDEAKEMNRIPAHACVLVVKDFGSIDKPFYVTEYLAGGSVGQAIRANGPLPPKLARRYATNIASAIAYIHAKRGKLHRDIKPENVLIDDDGSARLADFGLVWQMGEGSSGMRAGTVPYMPPEVVGDQRKNVGYEWDVYSFGATLYEMLTGHAPYADLLKREIESTGKTRLEVLRHLIGQVPPTPILSCNKSADRNLAKIADWAMARDARDRYFHVDHILADLDRLGRRKRPLGPQQTAGCEKSGRWCLARRSMIAVVLGLGVVAGLTWYLLPYLTDGRITADPSTPPSANGETHAAPPVTAGPLFEQSRLTSPLNLTFTTLGGVTQYRPAPPEQWAKIEGRSFDYEHEMPWRPAVDQALAFSARVDQPAHLTILMRDADGSLIQLLPNALETDTRLRPRRNRLIPQPIAPQTRSYWLKVTPPAATETIKAIVTDRPFTIPDLGGQGFPAVPKDFRVVVEGKSYDSFEAAFGDRWQTVDLTIQVVE